MSPAARPNRVPLLAPPNAWVCNGCGREHLASPGQTGTPLHPCRAVSGLMTPFTRPGVASKVVRVDRGDYSMGQELQVDDEGRVAAAVSVVRDDGEDRVVLAPCPTINVRERL